MKRKKKKNRIAICVISFVILLVAIVLFLSLRKEWEDDDNPLSDNLTQTLTSDETVTDNSPCAFSFSYDESIELSETEGEVIFEHAEFVDELYDVKEMEDHKSGIAYKINELMDPEDLVILKFRASAEEQYQRINVIITDSSYNATYTIPTEPTDFYIPIMGIDEYKFLFLEIEDENAKIHVSNIEMTNVGDPASYEGKYGLYYQGMYEAIVYNEEDGLGAGETGTILTDDTYLYSIRKGVLAVFEIDNDYELNLVAELDDLGRTRDMAFTDDKKAMIITARENGMKIVDISDPLAPKLLSTYDTLELATGVSVDGDYAYVSSRYFGTEVVCIEDLSNPCFCSYVRSNEEQIDSFFYDGYLYSSIWAQKAVRVYDASDPGNLVQVSVIELDGQGYGLFVEDGILYAATGYNSSNDCSCKYSPGYGMGNGFEIYDVSNPAEPQWLSTMKLDGRYLYNSRDIWRIKVSDKRAYLASTYNGLYVYDVEDPKAPKRLEHVTVHIQPDSINYQVNEEDKIVLPYDPTQYMHSAFTGLALLDGVVYISGSDTDIFMHECDMIQKVEESDEEVSVLPPDEVSTFCYEERFEAYRTGTMISDVEIVDDMMLVAAGVYGIHMLDMSMNLIEIIPTEGAVKDILIKDNILLTAESEMGIGIHTYIDGEITKVGSYNNDKYNRMFSQLQLSENNRYILAQAGWDRIEIIDIVDMMDPKRVDNIVPSGIGTMYYRNLINGVVADKYIGVAARKKLFWFSLNELGELELAKCVSNGFYGEANGVAAYGDYLVGLRNYGYAYSTVEEITDDEFEALNIVYVEGLKLKGKLSIHENLMFITEARNGDVTVIDITDMDNPVLISKFIIEGHPDLIKIHEDYILLPSRRSGLLKIPLDRLEELNE